MSGAVLFFASHILSSIHVSASRRVRCAAADSRPLPVTLVYRSKISTLLFRGFGAPLPPSRAYSSVSPGPPLGFSPVPANATPADADIVATFADNWLLRADQRTLVLTDFGAAVDALRPKRQVCSSSPAAPVPQFGASAATAATGPGEANFASLPSAPRQSTAAAGDGAGAAGAVSGGERKSWAADKEACLATTTTRCQPAAKRGLSVSERVGLTGERPSGIEVDEDVTAASPARKRRRHGVVEESCGEGVDQHGRDRPEMSSTALYDKLLLPFSKYCVAGTPSIVAPELSRAWREEKDLDFRRSDVSLCWLSGSACEIVVPLNGYERVVTIVHGKCRWSCISGIVHSFCG